MRQHDVSIRHIALAAAAIGLTIALVIAGVLGTLHAIDMPPGGDRLQPASTGQVPGPALQSAPQLDLQRYRDQKQRVLQSQGWIDPQHRTARIPVDQAMALLAQGAASAPGDER